MIEVEQLDGEKGENEGKETWAITGDIIRKSDEELLKPEPQELKTKDPDCRFYYTIRLKALVQYQRRQLGQSEAEARRRCCLVG